MTEHLPQNIVEAYAAASKAAAYNPELKEEAFDKVAAFCENNAKCLIENSVKRNVLLFWAYSNMAEAMMETGRFDEALKVLHKAKDLPEENEDKINTGFKMLEAIDRCRFSIPQKAAKITEVCRYMQKAYSDAGDYDGIKKMEHLQAAAEYLLGTPKHKN